MVVVQLIHQSQEEANLMTHTNQRIIKNKLGLLKLAEELGDETCQVMGVGYDTSSVPLSTPPRNRTQKAPSSQLAIPPTRRSENGQYAR